MGNFIFCAVLVQVQDHDYSKRWIPFSIPGINEKCKRRLANDIDLKTQVKICESDKFS